MWKVGSLNHTLVKPVTYTIYWDLVQYRDNMSEWEIRLAWPPSEATVSSYYKCAL